MVAGPGAAVRPVTDRFEDFCLRQVRDQEPEREAARERLVLRAPHVGAGARPPLDQPVLLQIAQRPPDGDPRRAERLHQVGFARQPLPGRKRPGCDFGPQRVVNLPVLGNRDGQPKLTYQYGMTGR